MGRGEPFTSALVCGVMERRRALRLQGWYFSAMAMMDRLDYLERDKLKVQRWFWRQAHTKTGPDAFKQRQAEMEKLRKEVESWFHMLDDPRKKYTQAEVAENIVHICTGRFAS